MSRRISRRQFLKLLAAAAASAGWGAACRRAPLAGQENFAVATATTTNHTRPAVATSPPFEGVTPAVTAPAAASPTVDPLAREWLFPGRPFLVDGHEDVAWNWFEFGRDPRMGALSGRQEEVGSAVPGFVGERVTGLPEWQQGGVALLFATIFVMPARRAAAWGGSLRQVYANNEAAQELALAQLEWYRELSEATEGLRLVESELGLRETIRPWVEGGGSEPSPVGLVLLMEGADPILQPQDVAAWHARGLRIVGPAWASTRYAGGTGEAGPLTEQGRALLREMAPLQMILDLSHLAEAAYLEAVESYDGPIIASHSNPRAFLPTDRGVSDEMIRLLAARDGVVGIIPYSAYLQPGWERGQPRVSLERVAEVIDYVVQLTGSAEHVAIGSDFDGGFGLDSLPAGMESVADLRLIGEALQARGYDEVERARILHGNWLRLLRRALA